MTHKHVIAHATRGKTFNKKWQMTRSAMFNYIYGAERNTKTDLLTFTLLTCTQTDDRRIPSHGRVFFSKR